MTAVAEKPRQYRDVKLDPVQGPKNVHPGDPIRFYDGPHAGRVPQAGIVLRTNLGTSIQIAVFRPEFHAYHVKDGVKWCNDPTLRPDELEQNGCWDYHPLVQAQQAILDRIDKVEASVSALTQPATKPVKN